MTNPPRPKAPVALAGGSHEHQGKCMPAPASTKTHGHGEATLELAPGSANKPHRTPCVPAVHQTHKALSQPAQGKPITPGCR